MKKIKALIVDDEESARDVLENLLIRFCPEVELIGKCDNILSAVDTINELNPDLVFLDIEMPNYAGYEIVNFFENIQFEMIFVTAYDKYAIRAFEIAAVDYLLKPIDIERLKNSISRVKSSVELKLNVENIALLKESLKSNEVNNLMISENGYQKVLATDTIVAIEAQESYCFIHTTDKKYMVSKNLKHFETIFIDSPSFIRVHKSWIINKKYLKNYSKTELVIHLSNGLIAKLSKYKKAEFEASIV